MKFTYNIIIFLNEIIFKIFLKLNLQMLDFCVCVSKPTSLKNSILKDIH